MRFADKIGPTKDVLDFVWRLCLRCFVLWSSPPAINVILKVPSTDEFFNFILKRDTLLYGVTDILMVPIILVLVPLKRSLHNGSGHLSTPVYSDAMKASSRDETRSV